jgi:Tol biopolymer transport system component
MAVVARQEAANNFNLWLLDLTQGTTTRLTSGPNSDSNPVFSPDGRSVAFRSNDGASYSLYQKASIGLGPEALLLKVSGGLNLTDWSRDWRWLVYHSNPPNRDIWVVPMKGDHKPFPFLRTRFNESGARLSPDVQWIAYISDESGRNEVYVQRFIPEPDGGVLPAAGKWLVSKGGGAGMIHWRADGRELYYLSPDGNVMAVEVATTPDFRASTPKALFQLPANFLHRFSFPGTLADVAADGQRFLFALPVQQDEPDEFNVVLNWQTGLTK